LSSFSIAYPRCFEKSLKRKRSMCVKGMFRYFM
jgi:hypothetical protein